MAKTKAAVKVAEPRGVKSQKPLVAQSVAEPSANKLLQFFDGINPQRAILLLTLACCLAYANSLGGDFVFDDADQIVDNKDIRSWDNLGKAFTTHVWAFRERPEALRTPVPPPYYRPLFTVLFTIEYQLFGLNPQGWHLTSLLLHLLCSVAVYFVLLELSRRKSVALLAALLFAVYSIHVESVAWISGVTDPLFSLFLLLSLFVFLRFRASKKIALLIASLCCFALAAFSKETALCLVPLIFAMTWLGLPTDTNPDNELAATATLASRLRRAVLWSLPYLAVAAFYLFARYLVLGAIVRDSEFTYRGSGLHILLSLPYVIVSYLLHLLYPVDLTLAYDAHFVTDVLSLRFLVPTVILLILTITTFVYRKRIPTQVWYALLLLFMPLLPVLHLRVLGDSNLVADRYLYLSTAGWTFLLALGIIKLASLEQNRSELQKLSAPFRRLGVASLSALALVAVLMMVTWSENRNWKDEISLWGQAAQKRPGNWFAHSNFGIMAFNAKNFSAAEQSFQAALAIKPESTDLHFYLALTYRLQGQFENAAAEFQRALDYLPDDPEITCELGLIYEKMGRKEEAVSTLKRAYSLSKDQALSQRIAMNLNKLTAAVP